VSRTHPPIITENICPPIGRRDHDWSAIYDGYEPGDPIGYGRTEDEAIEDLIENYDEPGAPLDVDRLREDRDDCSY
jgi:hypothetical protein